MHRPRDRGAGLRRGLVRRLPPAGRHGDLRALADTGVRVDQALESGQVVCTAYDPMLGKVIAHGPDREAARRALVDGARRHRDPRAHHQRRLPARAGRERRVPRRHHRHRVARPPRRSPSRRPRACPRVFAAWVQAAAGRGRRTPGTRSSPTAGGSARDPAPVVVELDEPVLVDRAAGTRRRTSTVRQLVGRAPRRGAQHRRPARARPSSTSSRTSPRSSTGASGSSSSGPTCSATTAGRRRRRVTAPMPGTVLDVRVAEGDAGRGGRGARRARGDEDGAGAQGAVRRHRHRPSARRPGDQVALGATLFVGRRGGLMELPTSSRSTGCPSASRSTRSARATACRTRRRWSRPTSRRSSSRRLLDAGLPIVEATSFVHPKWVPQLADAGRADDRCSASAGRDLPGAGAQRARPRPGPRARPAGTSRSSAAPPRPSRSKNLNRSLDEQFAMFEPTVAPGPRRRARRPRLRLDVLRRPVGGRGAGRAGRRRSASGSSTSAPASSASATPSASAPPAT